MSKEELLDFVAQNIARSSPNRRKLSVQVYGGQHLSEFKAAKGETPQEKLNGTHNAAKDAAVLDGKLAPRAAADRIDNIYTFKRSQQLHESLRGGKNVAYT